MANGRVVGIVALCAVVAVVAVVGGTLLLSRHEATALPAQPGKPVIQLELGLRTDAEAQALRRAQALLDQHKQAAQAAAIFGRYSSVEAQLGRAFAEWTGPGSLAAVKAIVAAAPGSPAALLNLGWANYWAGQNAAAASAWKQTASRFPDSPYAVDALDALHTGVAPGLPYIVVDPAAVPPRAKAALVAGVSSWNLKKMVSAQQQLDQAARLAPNSPEALVAAAVARFSPATPLAPFHLLGPLTARFPNDAIVRLHLGELLLWTRQVAKGTQQLRLAIAEQPKSIYARQARLILQALGQK